METNVTEERGKGEGKGKEEGEGWRKEGREEEQGREGEKQEVLERDFAKGSLFNQTSVASQPPPRPICVQHCQVQFTQRALLSWFSQSPPPWILDWVPGPQHPQDV